MRPNSLGLRGSIQIGKLVNQSADNGNPRDAGSDNLVNILCI